MCFRCIYRKFNFVVRFINENECKTNECAAYASLYKYKNCNARARCIRFVPSTIRITNYLIGFCIWKLFFILILFCFFFSSSFLCLSYASVASLSDGGSTTKILIAHENTRIISGDIILHTTMAMEIMGRRKNSCAYAWFGHWHLLGNWKETKEKITSRLFMG